MIKGVRDTHKQRHELLKLVLETEMPWSQELPIIEELENTPEENKESVAARILADIKAGKYPRED